MQIHYSFEAFWRTRHNHVGNDSSSSSSMSAREKARASSEHMKSYVVYQPNPKIGRWAMGWARHSRRLVVRMKKIMPLTIFEFLKSRPLFVALSLSPLFFHRPNQNRISKRIATNDGARSLSFAAWVLFSCMSLAIVATTSWQRRARVLSHAVPAKTDSSASHTGNIHHIYPSMDTYIHYTRSIIVMICYLSNRIILYCDAIQFSEMIRRRIERRMVRSQMQATIVGKVRICHFDTEHCIITFFMSTVCAHSKCILRLEILNMIYRVCTLAAWVVWRWCVASACQLN